MERAQIFVIVAVVAAVGLFGLRIFSERSVEEELAVAPADVRESGTHTSHGLQGSGGERSAGFAAGEHGKGSHPGSTDRAAGSDGGHRADKGSRIASGRAGSAHTVGGSGGEVGGSGGSGGGAIIGGRPVGGPRGAIGSASEVLAPKRLEANQTGRSDLVEYLASQPAPNQNGSLKVDENNQEVALELKRPEDAEPAAVKEEIKSPESDEDGLTFTEDSVLAFPDGGNVNGDAGTISFQIEPNWAGGDETNNSLVTLRGEHEWSNRIELVKNGRYLRFILADADGREADISVPIDSWEKGAAHDVQASWGESQTSLYIDGVLVGQNTYSKFTRPTAPLFIGSDHRGSPYSGMNATVRDFKVTNSASHGS